MLSWLTLVCTFTMVTRAPETTACAVSRTVPETAPVTSARAAQMLKTANIKTIEYLSANRYLLSFTVSTPENCEHNDTSEWGKSRGIGAGGTTGSIFLGFTGPDQRRWNRGRLC